MPFSNPLYPTYLFLAPPAEYPELGNRGLSIGFVNGTVQQRGMFEQALTVSRYDWSRLATRGSSTTGPGVLEVVWDAAVASDDGWGFFEKLDLGVDGSGNMESRYIVHLRSTIDLQPVAVHHEAVIHQMAHALLAQVGVLVNGNLEPPPSPFARPLYELVCEAFGGTPAEWTAGAWGDRIEEAFCETFKDIYLAREYRSSDNRTRWRISQANYTRLLDVMDNFCVVAAAS